MSVEERLAQIESDMAFLAGEILKRDKCGYDKEYLEKPDNIEYLATRRWLSDRYKKEDDESKELRKPNEWRQTYNQIRENHKQEALKEFRESDEYNDYISKTKEIYSDVIVREDRLNSIIQNKK